ncbi:MAG: FG-GAP repeat protein, partial [Phycisphaerales bacterium]|nr:FG-GAP repeat protein [Phycisphaerales bacterium]
MELREVLDPGDLVPTDLFGYSVAVDGDTVLIGAPWNDDKGADAGAVYMYDISTSPATLRGKAYSWDELAGDEFGTSVAIDGWVFMGGSPFSSATQANEGSVTVYRYDPFWEVWSIEDALRPKLGGEDSLFGYDIDIDGVNVIIGAPGSEDFSGNADRGMAYLFVDGGGGYFPEMVIESTSPEDGAFFGSAVGIQGDLFAVGAPYHSWGTGFVDIYYDDDANGTWDAFYTILPNSTTTNDFFGFAIDVGASTVYVGSLFGEGLGPDTGCVHGMQYNASSGIFMEEERFYASDITGSDLGGVGHSVAATNRQLMVGAPYDNGDQGSSLLFSAERFWTNPGGGLWADAANWSGGSVPESENPVIFSVPGAFIVDFPLGTAPEIQSLDMLDGNVWFDLVSGGLTCNAGNGKGVIVASDGTAALQVSQGFFDVGSNCVVGDSAGSDGLLRLDYVTMNVAETLSIGEEGNGHLSLFNYSVLEANKLTIGNNGGSGLLEAGAGDWMSFDPLDQSEYGVGLTDGVVYIEDSYLEAGGEGIRIDPDGFLEGRGTVVGDIFNVGQIEVTLGTPGLGPFTMNLYGTMIMVREEVSGDLSKGSLVTSWDGLDQVYLSISENAYLSGLYRLAVPFVNAVSSGDTFNVLTATTIVDDFECYLVPYVDETTYFSFTRDMRGGASTIEGNVNDLAIPFGFNSMVDGPVITGEARSIEPMDVDGDGDDDLVVLASGTDGGDAVCVLLNEDGALCLDAQVLVSGNPADIDSGDFDDDGDLDLAVSCLTSNKLQILENTSGSFTVVQTYDTGNKPVALSVFDWNNDDLPDIALINQDDDTLYVYTNI